MTRIRRSFTDEFKRGAVKLVKQSGAMVTHIARDLGIEASVLRRWVNQEREGVLDMRPNRPIRSEAATEVERLQRELRHMGEEDLLFLNRMVVERLNLLAQARSTVQLAQFAEGDRVEFTTNDGALKRGSVVRLKKKTASLLTDDGQQWKVSPALLRKQVGA
jgi:transposase-like protein